MLLQQFLTNQLLDRLHPAAAEACRITASLELGQLARQREEVRFSRRLREIGWVFAPGLFHGLRDSLSRSTVKSPSLRPRQPAAAERYNQQEVYDTVRDMLMKEYNIPRGYVDDKSIRGEVNKILRRFGAGKVS